MAITTYNGQPIDFNAGTYIKVGKVGQNFITTDIITRAGVRVAGPTVTKTAWAAIVKIQSLQKVAAQADRVATRNLKQARYAIVNGTASFKQIDRWTEIGSNASRRFERAMAAIDAIQRSA